MDERHLAAAIPYVERNPVRAGLCERASDWQWSSAWAYAQGTADSLVDRELLQHLLPGFDAREAAIRDADEEHIGQHTRTSRPLGGEAFIERLEAITGRSLKPRVPGPQLREALEDT